MRADGAEVRQERRRSGLAQRRADLALRVLPVLDERRRPRRRALPAADDPAAGAEVQDVVAAHAEAPHRRDAQRRLAARAHHARARRGAAARRPIPPPDCCSAAIPAEATGAVVRHARTGAAHRIGGRSTSWQAGMAAVDLAVATGLVTSRSDAGRALTAGELHVNGRRLEPGAEVSASRPAARPLPAGPAGQEALRAARRRPDPAAGAGPDREEIRNSGDLELASPRTPC